MDVIDRLGECVRRLGGTEIVVTESDTVSFCLGAVPAFAYVTRGGRLRGSAWIRLTGDDDSTMTEAQRWIELQPALRSGRLEVTLLSEEPSTEEDEFFIRLVFERPLDPRAIDPTDPLEDEAEALFAAWALPEVASVAEFRSEGTVTQDDPIEHPPTNAWMLVGGDDSYFSDDDLERMREDATRGIYEADWTVAKHTERGDLLFFYFRSPRKSIHFVARAADTAYFDNVGGTGGTWKKQQWFCHVSPLIPIDPIPRTDIETIQGPTVWRGRSGRYLRPEDMASLTQLIRPLNPADGPELTRVLQPVSGRADHPDPAIIDLATWRAIAAGSLALEVDVERILVEPLLRFVLDSQARSILQRRFKIGKRIADYAIMERDHPQSVIEAKVRIRYARDGKWGNCKDFAQALDYADTLGVPCLLIDAVELHVLAPGTDSPVLSCSRRDVTQNDIEQLRGLLLRSR